MNIIIKSADFKVRKGLETFVREKVQKLFTQSGNIICANVMLQRRIWQIGFSGCGCFTENFKKK